MKPSQILICILSTFIVLAAVCATCAGRSALVRVPSLPSVFGLKAEPVSPAERAEWGETTELSATSDSAELSALTDIVPIVLADTAPAPPKVVELPPSLAQTTLQLPASYINEWMNSKMYGKIEYNFKKGELTGGSLSKSRELRVF